MKIEFDEIVNVAKLCMAGLVANPALCNFERTSRSDEEFAEMAFQLAREFLKYQEYERSELKRENKRKNK